jgi:quercetin dioxygenase-like cupin family protein
MKDAAHDSRRIFINSATVTFTGLKVHATTAAAHRYAVRHSAHLNVLLVIVKEGAVESTVDGVSHLVGAGSIIFLVPGAIQTIQNRGDVPATYYVVAVSSEDTPRAA